MTYVLPVKERIRGSMKNLASGVAQQRDHSGIRHFSPARFTANDNSQQAMFNPVSGFSHTEKQKDEVDGSFNESNNTQAVGSLKMLSAAELQQIIDRRDMLMKAAAGQREQKEKENFLNAEKSSVLICDCFEKPMKTFADLQNCKTSYLLRLRADLPHMRLLMRKAVSSLISDGAYDAQRDRLTLHMQLQESGKNIRRIRALKSDRRRKRSESLHLFITLDIRALKRLAAQNELFKNNAANKDQTEEDLFAMSSEEQIRIRDEIILKAAGRDRIRPAFFISSDLTEQGEKLSAFLQQKRSRSDNRVLHKLLQSILSEKLPSSVLKVALSNSISDEEEADFACNMLQLQHDMLSHMDRHVLANERTGKRRVEELLSGSSELKLIQGLTFLSFTALFIRQIFAYRLHENCLSSGTVEPDCESVIEELQKRTAELRAEGLIYPPEINSEELIGLFTMMGIRIPDFESFTETLMANRVNMRKRDLS